MTYYTNLNKSIKQLRQNTSQRRSTTKNSAMSKDDINDVNRYKKHLKELYRAKEILNSNEPLEIQTHLLREIGCDTDTYGEWIIRAGGKEHLKKIKSKMSHIWALDREIRSFEYAIKLLEDLNKQQTQH